MNKLRVSTLSTPPRRTVLGGIVGLAGLSFAAPALAATASKATFTSMLRGDAPPANTGSKATGNARLVVDLVAQSVDLDLQVVGITIAQLWDQLKAQPIGPVHIHHYGSMAHMNDPSVSLVLPVPFGFAYSATADGFAVSLKGYSYAAGAALLNSKVSFADFMTSMRAGLLALNVHTNAYQDGEINGPIVPAA
jgi:hypothetical protein